jgi:hypothetical protein
MFAKPVRSGSLGWSTRADDGPIEVLLEPVLTPEGQGRNPHTNDRTPSTASALSGNALYNARE